jgi:hypothetical protein
MRHSCLLSSALRRQQKTERKVLRFDLVRAGHVRPLVRMLLTIIVVALCATQAVVAGMHRGPKEKAPVAAANPMTSLSIEGSKAYAAAVELYDDLSACLNVLSGIDAVFA